MFTAKVSPAGARAFDVTPIAETLRWTTLAVGGFGSCSFSIDGNRRKDIRYLSRLTLSDSAASTLWEGRIEDVGITIDDGEARTTIQAFGFHRLVADTSVRRVWSRRELPWQAVPTGNGGSIANGLVKGDLATTIGQYDLSDQDKVGVQFAGNNVSVANAAGDAVDVTLSDLILTRMLCTLTMSGVNVGPGELQAHISNSADGITYVGTNYTASQEIDHALDSAVMHVRLTAWNAGAATTFTATDLIQFSDIRLLGTVLTEDTAGGFYGGTIVRDLLTLIPDLAAGLIDAGNEYAIPALERVVRDTVLSVLREVTAYYPDREWAVWEDAQLDWATRDRDTPDYAVPVADIASLRIEGSLDGQTRTVYVAYTPVGANIASEASAASTDTRNPFVKQGKTKDEAVSTSFSLTAAAAAQLAATLAADRGGYPPAHGEIILNANQQVRRRAGQPLPAWHMRAGTNILIPDLPRDDFISGGRGQTLFHIVATDVDLEKGQVRLEVEGQTRRTDALLARLAAASRVFTG